MERWKCTQVLLTWHKTVASYVWPVVCCRLSACQEVCEIMMVFEEISFSHYWRCHSWLQNIYNLDYMTNYMVKCRWIPIFWIKVLPLSAANTISRCMQYWLCCFNDNTAVHEERSIKKWLTHVEHVHLPSQSPDKSQIEGVWDGWERWLGNRPLALVF